MGAENTRDARPYWCFGLRRDDPRREHVRSRDATYPRRVYPALSSSPPACMCRRHSARPPRERNSSSRGLINDHRVFPRRRNHLHLFVRYLARDCASFPCALCAEFFRNLTELLRPVIV